ncbi:MAG TPA: dihydrofolate reductase family protein [Gammaproteobacteria bacterium]|nr:dihydrofolate reductase family protein [Gammaproteobacteria bacterium]
MRKIIANAHVSLDGVMQAPGGPHEDPSNKFAYGGWSAPYADERSAEHLLAAMAQPFDLLLGRRTYEIFAAYWPYHTDNPIGERFDAATKYVVTRTLDRLEWQHAERLDGGVEKEIVRLKSGNGPDIHTWGSSELLHTLAASGLIDEYRLYIYPLVLGRGKRLFEPGATAQALSLVDSKTSSTGVSMNTYRPAGPVKTGSYADETPSDAELARRRKHASETGDTRSS